MSASDQQLTVEDLLMWIVGLAGGVAELAKQTGVKEVTIQRWLRGRFPRHRLMWTVERVHWWASRHADGGYPPPGYPRRGLLAYVVGSPDTDGAPEEHGSTDSPGDGFVLAAPRDHTASADAVDAAEDRSALLEESSAQHDHIQTEDHRERLPRSTGSRLSLRVLAIGVVGVVAVAATLVYLLLIRNESEPTPPPNGISVEVQNKFATGPQTLVEDDTPAYLSSELVPKCASRGCKLDGTDVWSGDRLVVSCQTQGQEMTNADWSSPGIERNPHEWTSNRWYLAIWPDGRTGYFPEIYLKPEYRGGLRLPKC